MINGDPIVVYIFLLWIISRLGDIRSKLASIDDEVTRIRKHLERE